MRNNSTGKKAKDECGCYCHVHCHGGKPVFIGLLLLIIGLALNYRYSLPEVLMLVGGILVVKGILVWNYRKDKE